jgi:hypothetical protein
MCAVRDSKFTLKYHQMIEKGMLVTTTFSQITQRNIMMVLVTMAGVLWLVGGLARWGVALSILLVVPGWWLHQYIPAPSPSRLGRLMLGAAVGPTVVAVVYMLAAAIGVAIPAWLLEWWLPVIAILALRRIWPLLGDSLWVTPGRWWGVLALMVAVLVMWTRYAQIAGLVFPPWVDAVHHALLIRVAYEQGHAPWSLVPYLPVTHLAYHSGYHSINAALLSASGLTPADLVAVLLNGGQMLNVLAVASVAALAWVWWRQWPAVIMAALVVGLIAIMPAYYLSWGRYTLLLGMVWLPVALIAIESLWDDTSARGWVWVALVLAGLSLVHMVVFVMALVWGVACLMRYWRVPARAFWAAGLAVLITLPWWWFVASQARAGAGASAMHVVGNASHNAFIDGLFWARNNRWLVPALIVAAWWGVRHHSLRIAQIVVWMCIVMLLANPVLIGLPYISFFTNETVITAMYVPMGLTIAWLLGWMVVRLPRWQLVAVLAMTVLAVLSANDLQQVINDETIIATADDLNAIQWIDANLPNDAVVLTNASGWMWQIDRGSDGGWWILPLTGRQVTTPPVLYTHGADDWVRQISVQTGQIRDADGSWPALQTFLQTHPAITTIYATNRGGAAKSDTLRGNPALIELYRVGDVTVFAVPR